MKTLKQSSGKPFQKARSIILPAGLKEGQLKAPKLRSLNLLTEASRLERLKKVRREQL